MSIEQYANNAFTTLNGSITSNASSLVVTNATSFPASPQFRLLIEAEVLLVTGVAGTTFSVSRGQEGTLAAAHADQAAVTHVLTSGGLVGVGGSVNLDGNYASLAAAGIVGREFWPSDGVAIYRDSGSSWTPWGAPINQLTAPPSASSFTAVNQTTGSLSGNVGSLFLNAPNIGLAHGEFWFQTLASGAYTWVVRLDPILFSSNDCQAGIALRDTGTGKIISFEYQATTSVTLALRVIQWSDANTRSSSALNLTITGASFPWMKVSDNASNRTYSVSRDGVNWLDVLTEGRTTFIGTAPNQAGIFAGPNGSAVALTVYSWSGV